MSLANQKKRVKYLKIVFERDRRTCWLCGCPVFRKDASLDHVTPVSKGGSDALSNLRLAHTWCNRKRGNRDVHPAVVRKWEARLVDSSRELVAYFLRVDVEDLDDVAAEKEVQDMARFLRVGVEDARALMIPPKDGDE